MTQLSQIGNELLWEEIHLREVALDLPTQMVEAEVVTVAMLTIHQVRPAPSTNYYTQGGEI